jgi:hypothetical protein
VADLNNTGRSFAPLVNILADAARALADLKSDGAADDTLRPPATTCNHPPARARRRLFPAGAPGGRGCSATHDPPPACRVPGRRHREPIGFPVRAACRRGTSTRLSPTGSTAPRPSSRRGPLRAARSPRFRGKMWRPLATHAGSNLMPEPDVLAIHELAALLRVGLKTAYTLVQNGEVGRRPAALPAQGYRGVDRRSDPTRPEGR